MTEIELKEFLASDFGSVEELGKAMTASNFLAMSSNRIKTEREEKIHKLVKILSDLTTRQRHCFFLNQVCSFSVEEIAESLGESPDRVLRDVNRSWKILKTQTIQRQ